MTIFQILRFPYRFIIAFYVVRSVGTQK